MSRPSAEYTVRHARADERPAILELLRVSMGDASNAGCEDYWQWKHEANPFGRSAVLVAECDGRLVGLRAFMRWQFGQGSEAVRAVRAVDTATHPEFRGRGIFRALTTRLVDEVGADGVHLVFNTPNDKSRPGYLKMGWQVVGQIPLWVRPSGRGILARGLGREIGSTSVVAGDAREILSQLPDSLHRRGTDRSGRLSTDLSDAYLRWRYADAPTVNYKAAVCESRGHSALAIFREKERNGLREIVVCDVLWTTGRRGAFQSVRVLRGVLARSHYDYAAACCVNQPVLRKVLAMAGFIPSPKRGPILTARRMSTPMVHAPDKWATWAPSIGTLELF